MKYLSSLLILFALLLQISSSSLVNATILSRLSTRVSESFSSHFLSSIKFEQVIDLKYALLKRVVSDSDLLFSVENTTVILDFKNLNEFKLSNLEFDYKIERIKNDKKFLWDQGKISLGNVSVDVEFDIFTIPKISNASIPLQFVNISSVNLLQDFDLKIKSKLLGKTISNVLGDSISQIIIPIFVEEIEIVLMDSFTMISNLLINIFVGGLMMVLILKSIRKMF